MAAENRPSAEVLRSLQRKQLACVDPQLALRAGIQGPIKIYTCQHSCFQGLYVARHQASFLGAACHLGGLPARALAAATSHAQPPQLRGGLCRRSERCQQQRAQGRGTSPLAQLALFESGRPFVVLPARHFHRAWRATLWRACASLESPCSLHSELPAVSHAPRLALVAHCPPPRQLEAGTQPGASQSSLAP